MPPENFRFGGGADETLLHPVVLVAMLITIALVLVLPRKYVMFPFLASTFLIPLPQEVLISGLHFFVYRFIILALAIRILVVKLSSPDGPFGGRLDRFDLLFLLWAVFRATAVVLLFRVPGAAINQAAFLLDVVGGFFILRYLIADEDDIFRAVKTLAVIALLISCSMAYEKTHALNPFGILGGVRLEPEAREALVRAQGPFQHEILAGSFGATLVPLFFLLWKTRKAMILAVLGLAAAATITITSSSSTPLFACVAGVGAICYWPMRNHMRLTRWAIVLGIAALSLVMKAPVWFLIARVGIVGGSSGYHRAMLVNNFILRFQDWWLIGTKENATWGTNMWDLSNQFVAEGQTGGLATFICFIALICIAFSRLGRARKIVQGDSAKEWYFWIIGSALFAQLSAFMGISYFDQVRVLWFTVLVIAVVATTPYLQAAAEERAPIRDLARANVPQRSVIRPLPGLPLSRRPKAFGNENS